MIGWGGAAGSTGDGRGSKPWWSLEGDERARAVFQTATHMRDDQSIRWAGLEQGYCLYDDASGSDLESAEFVFASIPGEQRTPLNVVRSCCDTVRAELIQSKPRPYVLPAGADWETRKLCQKLNKFLLGVLSSESFDRTASAVALDSLVFGTGAIRVLVEDGQVSLDRVPPWELWSDPDEGRYGDPRSLYLTRLMSREVLKALYPDKADDIDRASSGVGGRRLSRAADLVAVVEAWHRPSGKGEGDGCHVLALDRVVLLEEEWPHDWFPFAFLRWKQPLQGFWGQGLAAELVEPQRDLNRAVYAAQVGQRLNTFPRIVAPRNGGLNVEELTDEPGTVLWYNGNQAPAALVWPGVSPEIYSWIKDTIAWAYQLSGVSTSAARAERAAGLASGEAIKLNSDLQSRRFIDAQRAFEQLYVDVGRGVVRVVGHHAGDGDDDNDLSVVYRGKYRAERIKWADVKIDESSFVVRIEAASSLPSTPAGRVDYIQGLVSSGFAQQAGMPPALAARALQAPDSESLTDFISVAFDLAEEVCARILDDGDGGYMVPEPYFNLSVCFLVGVVTYQQWRVWDVPEERLDILRDWIEEVRALLERSQQPPQAPQQPNQPPGPPPGAMMAEAA